MARVTMVTGPADYPGEPDDATQAALADLFGTLFPGVSEPAFDEFHEGMAVAAHHPAMALQLARTSGVIAAQTEWAMKRDLRELAIQTVNLHFGSAYSFRSRLPNCTAAGVSAEQLAALPFWKSSDLFSAEQRLAIEYARAVVTGQVPDALFARAKGAWGEKGAVEASALIAYWSFWALFLNATRPDPEIGPD